MFTVNKIPCIKRGEGDTGFALRQIYTVMAWRAAKGGWYWGYRRGVRGSYKDLTGLSSSGAEICLVYKLFTAKVLM